MEQGNKDKSKRSHGARKRPVRNALTEEILQQFYKDGSDDGQQEEIFQSEIEPETQSFQSQALEVQRPGPEFDPTLQPQDGNQFLTHMLYERERCPIVLKRQPKNLSTSLTQDKNINVSFQENFPTSESLSSELKPTPNWVDEQCQKFMKARSHVTRLRMLATSDPFAEEISVQPPMPADEEDVWQQFCRQHAPKLSIMQNIRQRQLELLLDWLSEWLQCCPSTIDDENTVVGAACDTPPDLAGKEHWLGLWIYATLASLQMPLEPHVHSTLREIARSCLILRGRLAANESQHAIPYNLFLAIIIVFFRQLDFEDYFK